MNAIFRLSIILLATSTVFALHGLSAHAETVSPVTVSEDASSYKLENGLLTATVSKTDGKLFSLLYKGIETLDPTGGARGYWSHSAASPTTTGSITIDPKTNGGERAEVSIKGVSSGQKLGSGPGGGAVVDVEIRYAIERGMPGIYTYSILAHKSDYPATSIGEARFCAKLNDSVFDWMTVDANRNMKMITAFDWNHGTPMNGKEMRRMNTGLYKGQVEHKYDYSANQFDVLAWGWSSTAKHVGIWFVNPTIEYLSGGSTKVELSAHRDATFTESLTAPAPPCLLNYWRGSHYGGTKCEIDQGEEWAKVVGPFLIYCNNGSTPDEMWKDALNRSSKESAAWPYQWVSGASYPHRDERAEVTGQFTLKDAQAPNFKFTKLLVGLTHPDYATEQDKSPVDWQHDAKYYQFWTRGKTDGTFSIPNVRPGTYTLHALADGVLGEFAKTDVKVEAGKPLSIGDLVWQPVRYGKQLWDIGIPNRTGIEFFKGDQYFHWGWYLEYAKLFPKDVNYVVGKSDYRREWFFEQVPHNEDPANVTGKGKGRSTTWSITYDLPQAPRGKAILRLAICGIGTKTIDITVNDKPVESITGLAYNATINRDGIGGSWLEKDVTFDASLMQSGSNVLKLTIPAGGLMDGIIYDYLRLELDESKQP